MNQKTTGEICPEYILTSSPNPNRPSNAAESIKLPGAIICGVAFDDNNPKPNKAKRGTFLILRNSGAFLRAPVLEVQVDPLFMASLSPEDVAYVDLWADRERQRIGRTGHEGGAREANCLGGGGDIRVA